MTDIAEPIIKRLNKLTEAINSSGINDDSTSVFKHLLAHSGLLDAFLVLYDECNNDVLKKNSHILSFIKKYRTAVEELRRLRVNLNDFEQKKVIGKGHFGVVKVVREKQTGNVYALKILQKSESLSQHVSFYEEERDIMAKANSPWLTHLQYAFQDEAHLYLLMDFHPGGDLLSLLDRYNYLLPEPMMLFYVSEIAVSLHELHNMGYVHRDVKPENILIDRCGHIKLADFGSAAKLTLDKTVDSEMPVGTPDYIAPELLASINKTSKYGPSYGVECDFWSLGIMAYEMLYGETPFRGDNVVTTYSNIMNHREKLKFPTTDENKVSEEAVDLIRNLVCSSDVRLGYKSIAKHPFFSRTDWNNLEAVRPPFIPVVTSQEDTSNFEEFEYKQNSPTAELFKSSKEAFSGHQLPFVGFTYARPANGDSAEESAFSQSVLGISLNATLLDSKTSSELEVELKAKKRALHEAHLKIKRLSQVNQKNPTVVEMEKRALVAERRAELLEEEVESLKKDVEYRNAKIKKLKDLLASETSKVAKAEAKTLEFLKGIKEKWKKSEEEKIKHLTENIECYRKAAESSSNEQEVALKRLFDLKTDFSKIEEAAIKYRKSFKDKEKEVQKLQNELTKLNENFSKVKALNQKAQSETKENFEATIDVQRQEISTLRLDLENLKESVSESESREKSVNQEAEKYKKDSLQLQEEKCRLEKELSRYKIMREKENETAIHQLEVKLQDEQKQTYDLRIKIEELRQNINESISSKESFMSEKESIESKLHDTEEELHAIIREKGNLQMELSIISARENEQKEKIGNLETLLDSLKGTLVRLENNQTESLSKMNCEKTQAQMELLEKQLKTAQDTAASAVEKMHLAEETSSKHARELSDVKLDLRSAQRDLKQSQETVQYLRERSKELRDTVKEKENEIKEHNVKQLDLMQQITKGEENCNKLQNTIERVELLKQEAVNEIDSHKKGKAELQRQINDLNIRIISLQSDVDKAKVDKRGFEIEIERLKSNLTKEKDRESNLAKEIATLKNDLDNARTTIDQLKSICSEQDEQLNVLDQCEEKLEAQEKQKQSLEQEINRLQSEIKTSKSGANEEKSLRLFQEKRVKDLENKLAEAELEWDQQKSNLNDEIYQLKGEVASLQSQILQLENDLQETNCSVRQAERGKVDLEDQLELLKNEVEGHISYIHSLKDSNFKLTDGLEEAVSKGELYKKRVDEFEKDMKDKKAIFADKELKLKSTIGQQTKLIDFLQTKVENTPKKKAPLARMFGASKDKENVAKFPDRHFRKVEDALERERAHTRDLSTQLSKAHAEIIALKAQATSKMGGIKNKDELEDISKSPSVHEGNAKERMRHKIPHRWQTHLMMRAGRCSGCLGSIPFSRNASKCQDCGVVVHSKCSRNMGNTCGLPKAFARHFKQSQVKCAQSDNSPPASSESKVLMKGWLKVPKSGKAIWDNRYAVLTEADFSLFDQDPSTTSSVQPLKVISFSELKSKICILHSVAMSELPTTTVTDLPYVLKIDCGKNSERENLPAVYMMTASFEEKQSWISALDYVVSLIQVSGQVEEANKDTITVDNLITLNSVSNLDVNTILYINDRSAIVGAVEGLFSFSVDENSRLKFRARIDGATSVYEVLLIESIGVAVFIGGKDNNLFHTSLAALRTAADASHVAKPALEQVAIEPKISCHLISANEHGKRVFMCAAASNRISIFVWSKDRGTFEVCRQYSTQEPCSCFEFSPSSLIVGAERFYAIDLKNFEIQEFLDESDTSLAYAIYGTAQMSSFPVAIIKICGSPKNEEYLLAFYEFAIFVDSKGRRTREFDLKFVSLPVAVAFLAPHLFILHHNSVEVVEIRPDSFARVGGGELDSDTDCAPDVKTARTSITKGRFVGRGSDDKSILVATNSDAGVTILAARADFSSDADSSLTWSSASSQSNYKTSDTPETLSLCSEMSENAGDASTLKRSKFPNFMRASKRSKRQT